MVHAAKNYTIFFLALLTTGLLACDSPPTLRPLTDHAVVLAFGDSLTYGTGTSKQMAYPGRLQKMISRKVINAGVPGEISKTGLTRLNQLLKRHSPELLILCHGGNDILRHSDLKQTKDNLQQMINLAKNNNTQVMLIGVPSFGLFLSAAPFYEELASENQLPIENTVLSEILANNSLKSDQIHPNSTGYGVFAERIHSLLLKTGAI